MAFPSRLLNDGEHVVVHTRTHAKAMLVPALLLILIAFGTGLLYSLLPDQGGARLLVQAVFWGIAAVLIQIRRGERATRYGSVGPRRHAYGAFGGPHSGIDGPRLAADPLPPGEPRRPRGPGPPGARDTRERCWSYPPVRSASRSPLRACPAR